MQKLHGPSRQGLAFHEKKDLPQTSGLQQSRFQSVASREIDDDYLINLFWLKSLFYYVLNDGLIQNRQQLFRGYLCCR